MIIDLTPYAVSAVGIALGVVARLGFAEVAAHVKNAALRDLLDTLLSDAIGKIQDASSAEIAEAQALHPEVSPLLAVGVRFALAHGMAALEAQGLTDPAQIADRLSAKLGLANIATNLAIAGSPSPDTPHPLAPVAYPPGMTTAQLNAAEAQRVGAVT